MKKVFLYLYPIEEYTKMFLIDDKLYHDLNIEKPLPILNECIQKRYRENGYQVVFALYPDKDIFGIIPSKEDKFIFTDVLFKDTSAYDEKGNKKKDFQPRYPNEHLLIRSIGTIDELVIGGYHAKDCVKRVGEIALSMGINTIIDLDMTELFFNLYKSKEYFNIEEYNPQRYKEYMINRHSMYGREFAENHFNRTYSSLVYGFSEAENKKLK